MAAYDIMPFKSFNGGTITVKTGIMATGEVFEVGEPVESLDDGTMNEPTDDLGQWTVAQFTSTMANSALQGGIACYGPGAGNLNPQTGVAYAANDEISYWPINEGTIFITSNMRVAGGAADAAPVQSDVGEAYQVSYNTTAGQLGWGLERTTAVPGTDVEARVVDVLDTNKAPISRTGGTGVHVLFELVATSG